MKRTRLHERHPLFAADIDKRETAEGLCLQD